jgi:hypothetical protein
MGESFPEPLMRSEAHAFTTAGGPTTVKVPALSTPHEVHSIVHDTSLASANDARCMRGFPNFGDLSSLLSIGKLLEEDPESAVLIFNTFRFFVEAPAPIAGELLSWSTAVRGLVPVAVNERNIFLFNTDKQYFKYLVYRYLFEIIFHFLC